MEAPAGTSAQRKEPGCIHTPNVFWSCILRDKRKAHKINKDKQTTQGICDARCATSTFFIQGLFNTVLPGAPIRLEPTAKHPCNVVTHRTPNKKRCSTSRNMPHLRRINGCFKILPSGGLYATYHVLGEPETTIERISFSILNPIMTHWGRMVSRWPQD